MGNDWIGEASSVPRVGQVQQSLTAAGGIKNGLRHGVNLSKSLASRIRSTVSGSRGTIHEIFLRPE
jgi:hypothetical protein